MLSKTLVYGFISFLLTLSATLYLLHLDTQKLPLLTPELTLPVAPAPSIVASTNEPKCGRVLMKKENQNDKISIVNGRDALKGETPWFATIVTSIDRAFCGGSIVNKRHVITAAHCVWDWYKQPSNRSVILGSIDFTGYSQKISIKSVVMHPEYYGETYFDDIAILKLSEDIVYNDFVQPICLPEPEMSGEKLVNQVVTLVGYGREAYQGSIPSTLKTVDVMVLEKSACNKAYEVSNKPVSANKNVICAGFLQGGKDACQGDSGGPLSIQHENINYLAGIVSFGFECGKPGYPGIYTEVVKFLDFIRKNIE